MCRRWLVVERKVILWQHLFGSQFHSKLHTDARMPWKQLFREALYMTSADGVAFSALDIPEGRTGTRRSGHTASQAELAGIANEPCKNYLILFGGATTNYQFTCDLDVYDIDRSEFVLSACRSVQPKVVLVHIYETFLTYDITPKAKWYHTIAQVASFCRGSDYQLKLPPAQCQQHRPGSGNS